MPFRAHKNQSCKSRKAFSLQDPWHIDVQTQCHAPQHLFPFFFLTTSSITKNWVFNNKTLYNFVIHVIFFLFFLLELIRFLLLFFKADWCYWEAVKYKLSCSGPYSWSYIKKNSVSCLEYRLYVMMFIFLNLTLCTFILFHTNRVWKSFQTCLGWISPSVNVILLFCLIHLG